MERLTERFSNGQAAVYGCGNNCKWDYKYCADARENCPTINEIYEKLATFEDMEEQGRIVKLPCKTVYNIVDKGTKYATVMSKDIKDLTLYDIEGIDKKGYYFSTKEKAERAMDGADDE